MIRWLAVLALVLCSGAAAGNPHNSASVAAFTPGMFRIQQPVEQESPNYFFNNCGGIPDQPVCDPSTWVYNPTGCLAGMFDPSGASCQSYGIVAGCAWDLDDSSAMVASGDVGSTIAGSLCVVADQYDNFGQDDHKLYVRVTAPKDGLSVVLTNDRGVSVAVLPVRNGHGYLWETCWVDRTPGPYPVISGSNGGTGVFVNYTLTVSPTGRTVRDVLAVLQSGASGEYTPHCP